MRNGKRGWRRGKGGGGGEEGGGKGGKRGGGERTDHGLGGCSRQSTQKL